MKLDLLKKIKPTKDFIDVFTIAREEALNYNSLMITPRHLLLGIAIQGGTCVDILIEVLTMTKEEFLETLRKDIHTSDIQRNNKNLSLSPSANDYFVWATEQAESMHHNLLHPGHLLLSFCSDSGSFLCRLLKAKVGMAGGAYEKINNWLKQNKDLQLKK